ncbi:MAG: single-strand DNA-binding protein [Planctomycetota bacterium]|jgi:single-strand DNA-binding protein
MASYNKVILMGNLTRDPEMRHTQSGMAVCSASIAVNEKFKDAGGEWQERSTFVDVTIWGKRGEAFAKFHKKGASAFIEGKLRLDQWEDKQSGQKRSKLFVVGDNWEFVGGAREGGGQGGGGGGGDSWGGGQASAPAPSQSQGQGQGGGDSWGAPAASAPDSFDDTPF